MQPERITHPVPGPSDAATDENISATVKLKAITEALACRGLPVKSIVAVDISVKQHDATFEQMLGGSRAAHRGEPPALAASGHDAIEAEIVEDDFPTRKSPGQSAGF